MSRSQWVKKSCDTWHCFDLSLLPKSLSRDNSAYIHRIPNAQIQKIVLLQVVDSDEDTCD